MVTEDQAPRWLRRAAEAFDLDWIRQNQNPPDGHGRTAIQPTRRGAMPQQSSGSLESVGGEWTAAVWSKLDDDGLLVWFGQASRIPPTLDFFDWRGGLSGTIRKFAYTESQTTDGQDLMYSSNASSTVLRTSIDSGARSGRRGVDHPLRRQPPRQSSTPVMPGPRTSLI
jgi:hypothetical protein